jgi:parallel beta-helix repeat protein
VKKSGKIGTVLVVIIFLLQGVAIQQVTAQPLLISITVDGTVEGTTAIQRNGNIYTLTSNLEQASIVIDASNIMLDGAGFNFHGEIYELNGNNVEIKNLKITSLATAIQVYGSNCKITNNEIQAEYGGIKILDTDSHIISGNKIDAKVNAGISFGSSSHNTITENTIASSIVGGVDLVYSDYNTFSRNKMNCVSLYESSYNIFDENNLPQGISIRKKSNYNEITENSIIDFNELTEKTTLSSGSVTIERSEGNIVSSNTIVNSGGIFIKTSSNNVFRNNSVSATGIGFEVSGDPQPSLSSFINDIDDSNTINGKKIYYLIDKSDLNINPSTYPNIGYLALVNCKRMIVENNQLNTQGMLLAWTTNSRITKNDVSNNPGNGIILNYASNNQITQNNINSNSETGIHLSYSNDNTILCNYIARNEAGLSLLDYSSNNTIKENIVADQDIGIHLCASSSNLIFKNNFVNNTKQVYDFGWEGVDQFFPGIPLPSENVWDNGYQTGGNYWSNYADKYPDAKELENSGIWGTPYVIDELNKDNYPLMEPYTINLNIPELQNPSLSPEATITESLPITLVIASIVLAAVFSLGLIVYFKRRKHRGILP